MLPKDDTQQNAELRQAFLKHLPRRIEAVRKRGHRVCRGVWDVNTVTLLYQDVQGLAGAAGRYGMLDASERLFQVERLLEPLIRQLRMPTAEDRTAIEGHLETLMAVAEPPAPVTRSARDFLVPQPERFGYLLGAGSLRPPEEYWRRFSHREVAVITSETHGQAPAAHAAGVSGWAPGSRDVASFASAESGEPRLVNGGLGFALGTLDGQRMVRHGGAIYGFATELVALPAARLGVAVSASKDFANGTVERIALEVLRQALAAREGAARAAPRSTPSMTREDALALAGTFGAGDRRVELIARDTLLYLDATRGDIRLRLRRLGGDTLVVDDPATYGTIARRTADRLIMGRDTLALVPAQAARRELPARWNGLIGEYGWDHDVLYIYERHGRLTALIEWFAEYPLREVGPNEFAFPDYGLYAGERLRFTRDGRGRATQVVAAEVTFARRKIPGEDAAVFRITPVKPVNVLRRDALAATPPTESGTFRESDLVELVTLDRGIKLDVRYATRDNFLSVPVYTQARAFLQRPAAEALVRAHRALRAKGFGLLVHDGYRPWYVTKMFWDGTPEANHIFVADPSRGSRHNRGCAVDLTMYDLATGRPVRMTGGYDEMSDRSYPDYPGGTSRQRELREILRAAMEAEGFLVYEAEWWHFDYKDWREYRIGNQRFEALGK